MTVLKGRDRLSIGTERAEDVIIALSQACYPSIEALIEGEAMKARLTIEYELDWPTGLTLVELHQREVER
jgi:hypothetical protein